MRADGVCFAAEQTKQLTLTDFHIRAAKKRKCVFLLLDK